ncbi:MAG: hypothetical protein HDR89_06135 [Bacteroides sp.]|nr:hypothetical protein [Bacteroides sp.]
MKIKLARALDDNHHTRQWHNIIDWLIVAMILISTAEIFVSTFDVAPELRRVLRWVGVLTTPAPTVRTHPYLKNNDYLCSQIIITFRHA